MRAARWITITEEVAANLEGNIPNVEMSLEEWMQLLYESLSDHEYDE